MKCPAVFCDFKGTDGEVLEHLDFVRRTGLEAGSHGYPEPAERPFEERLDWEERNDG